MRAPDPSAPGAPGVPSVASLTLANLYLSVSPPAVAVNNIELVGSGFNEAVCSPNAV